MPKTIKEINEKIKKGDVVVVTAEEIIKKHILKDFPGDNIISEEKPLKQESDFSWIIDPLDGTHNYIHNINIFGTSVALAYGDEVVVGAIYMLPEGGFYFARKGAGAYLNGRRIFVSERGMKEATILFDSSIRYQKRRMLKGLGNIVDEVFNIRMTGSTVRGLCYVAEGNAEAEIEYNDKVWDFAAGLLIAEEAGGRATDLSGKKWNIKTKEYVVSNGKIHNKILALIKPGK